MGSGPEGVDEPHPRGEGARPAPQAPRRVAPEVLRHRIIPNYNATGEGITVEDVVVKLLQDVPEPSYKE